VRLGAGRGDDDESTSGSLGTAPWHRDARPRLLPTVVSGRSGDGRSDGGGRGGGDGGGEHDTVGAREGLPRECGEGCCVRGNVELGARSRWRELTKADVVSSGGDRMGLGCRFLKVSIFQWYSFAYFLVQLLIFAYFLVQLFLPF